MHSILSDYNFFDMLDVLTRYCQPGEVVLRDPTGDHAPCDLRRSLSSAGASVKGVNFTSGGGQPQEITTVISGPFPTRERRFQIIWSRNRHGWANPETTGSTTVHYFVPRDLVRQPFYGYEDGLASLCRRNGMYHDKPFWPIDPKYKYCKTCLKLYQGFISTLTPPPLLAESGAATQTPTAATPEPSLVVQSPEERAVFYYAENGISRGPFTLTEMRAFLADGMFDSETFIFREGGTDWLTVRDFPELIQ